MSEFVDELNKGLGEGPLTLGIYCTKCKAQFDLDITAVTFAIKMQTSFLEYLRFVQSAKCPMCEE